MKWLDIGWSERRRTRGPGLVLAALACVVLLSACHAIGQSAGATGRRSSHQPARSHAGPSGVATNGPDVPQQVVTAWFSAELAFETAALSSDPDQPDLMATTVSPQIQWTRALLGRMRATGEISRGSMHFFTPHVDVLSSRLATVTACGHDAEVVVSAQTGRPVPGVAGQVDFEYFVSVMELTDSGWKLASQAIRVGPCEPK
jgi:hypothetical protein